MPMIRALGPGSVSSFLKAILDVFYVVLWFIAGALALLIFGVLLISFDPQVIPQSVLISARANSHESFPSTALMIVAGEVQVACVLIIVQRLRKIFATMTAGDPFHPENVRRLRVVGLFLGLLEFSRYIFGAMHEFVLHEPAPQSENFNLTAWFAVLVVFVLAEVFREGARLRRDAELTI
jgi:hypothetical protein